MSPLAQELLDLPSKLSVPAPYDSDFSFASAELGVNTSFGLIDMPFGRVAVPYTYTFRRVVTHHTVHSENLRLLGFPSRRFPTSTSFYSWIRLYAPQVGDFTSLDSLDAPTLSPSKKAVKPIKAHRSNYSREVKTKRKAPINPVIHERTVSFFDKEERGRHTDPSARLLSSLSIFQIGAVWRVLHKDFNSFRGVWNRAFRAYNRIRALCPLLNRYVMSPDQVTTVVGWINSMVLSEIHSEKIAKLPPPPSVSFFLNDQPYCLSYEHGSIFSRHAGTDPRAVLFHIAEIIKKRVERNGLALHGFGKQRISFFFGKERYQATSVSQFCRQLGLSFTLDAGVACSGNSGFLLRMLEELKRLFLQFKDLIVEHPYISQLVVVFFVEALRHWVKSDILSAISFIAGTFLLSSSLSNIIYNMIDEPVTPDNSVTLLSTLSPTSTTSSPSSDSSSSRSSCSDTPVTTTSSSSADSSSSNSSFSDIGSPLSSSPASPEAVNGGLAAASFSLGQAFKNAIACVMGTHYDEKQLEHDAKQASRLSSFLHFVNSSYRTGVIVLSMLTSFLPYAYTKFTGKPWDVDEPGRLLEEFEQAYSHCRLVIKKKLLNPDRTVLSRHLHSISTIPRRLGPDFRLYSSLMQRATDLVVDMDSFLRNNFGNLTRQVPVHMFLTGAPGTGKTVAASYVCRAFNAIAGSSYDDVYTPTVTSLYHEAYVSQMSTLLDDNGQAITKELIEGLMLSLFFMIGSSPYSMDAAAIDKKGSTMFVSKLVVTTSNSPPQTLAQHVACPDAFLRRVHITASVAKNAAGEHVFHISPDYSSMLHLFKDLLPELNSSGNYEVSSDDMVNIVTIVENFLAQEFATLGTISDAFKKKYPVRALPTITEDFIQLQAHSAEKPSLWSRFCSLFGKKEPPKVPVDPDSFIPDISPEDFDEASSYVSPCQKLKDFIFLPFRKAQQIWSIGAKIESFTLRLAAATYALLRAFLLLILSWVALVIAIVVGTKVISWFSESKEDEKPNVTVDSLEPHSYSNIQRLKRPTVAVAKLPLQSHGLVGPVQKKIERNLCRVTVGQETHSGIMVQGRWLMITCHILELAGLDSLLIIRPQDCSVGFPTSLTYNLKDCIVRKDQFADLAMVELPLRDNFSVVLEEKASILEHFVPNAFSVVLDTSRVPVLYHDPAGVWNASALRSSAQPVSYYHSPSRRSFISQCYEFAGRIDFGDCSEPLVLSDPLTEGSIFAVVISHYNGLSYAVSRHQRMIRNLISPCDLRAHSYTRVPGLSKKSSRTASALMDCQTRATDHYTVTDSNGKYVQFGYLPNASAYIPNPRASVKLTSLEGPTVLRPTRSGKDPIRLALAKNDITAPPETVLSQEYFTQHYLRYFKSIIGDATFHPISPEEAFFGSRTLGVSGFNRNASVGLVDGKKLKGADFIDPTSDPDFPTLAPFVHSALIDFRANPWKYPAVMSLKDELTTPKKIEDAKTRLFYAVNGIQNLDAKMFLAPFYSFLRKFGNKSGFMVGTPFGVRSQTQHLAHEMAGHSESKNFAGDFVGFDKCRIRKMWIGQREAMKHFFSHEYHSEIDRIFEMLYNPYVCLEEQCFRLHDIVLSGGPATAEVNTVDVNVAIRMVFDSIGEMDKLQRVFAYGDDFWVVAHPSTTMTSANLKQRMLDFFGWDMVSPDKVSALPEFYLTSDFLFCKRSFAGVNMVRSLEDLKVAGGWMKKRAPVDTALQTIRNNLREAALYPDHLASHDALLTHFLENTTYSREELLLDPELLTLDQVFREFEEPSVGGLACSGRKTDNPAAHVPSSSNEEVPPLLPVEQHPRSVFSFDPFSPSSLSPPLPDTILPDLSIIPSPQSLPSVLPPPPPPRTLPFAVHTQEIPTVCGRALWMSPVHAADQHPRLSYEKIDLCVYSYSKRCDSMISANSLGAVAPPGAVPTFVTYENVYPAISTFLSSTEVLDILEELSICQNEPRFRRFLEFFWQLSTSQLFFMSMTLFSKEEMAAICPNGVLRLDFFTTLTARELCRSLCDFPLPSSSILRRAHFVMSLAQHGVFELITAALMVAEYPVHLWQGPPYQYVITRHSDLLPFLVPFFNFLRGDQVPQVAVMPLSLPLSHEIMEHVPLSIVARPNKWAHILLHPREFLWHPTNSNIRLLPQVPWPPSRLPPSTTVVWVKYPVRTHFASKSGAPAVFGSAASVDVVPGHVKDVNPAYLLAIYKESLSATTTPAVSCAILESFLSMKYDFAKAWSIYNSVEHFDPVFTARLFAAYYMPELLGPDLASEQAYFLFYALCSLTQFFTQTVKDYFKQAKTTLSSSASRLIEKIKKLFSLEFLRSFFSLL